MADSRIHVYHNLATMLNAGMPISRALKTVETHGRFGRTIRRLEEEVTRGHALSDAVDIHKRKLAKLDIALIKVGEHTGQLAETFDLLSEWYDFCQRIRRAVFSGLIIPLAEIHLAALIVPVVPFALGGWEIGVYVGGVIRFLSTFYLPALVVFGILKLTPREGFFRRVLDTVVISIPFIGKTIRELELGRYCKVFSTTYKAGVPIVRCSEMALDSVANRAIKDRLKKAHEQVLEGNEMSKGFGPGLPREFKAIWEVGEESGDLDESCRRLGNMHAENAENRFKILSKILPLIIYFGVMLILAYYVFKGYSAIYGGLSF